MLKAFFFEGGPHDGHRVDGSDAHPDTLFEIAFDDGSSYARAGRQTADQAGVVREVFQFDPDGSLTERARREYAGLD